MSEALKKIDVNDFEPLINEEELISELILNLKNSIEDTQNNKEINDQKEKDNGNNSDRELLQNEGMKDENGEEDKQ